MGREDDRSVICEIAYKHLTKWKRVYNVRHYEFEGRSQFSYALPFSVKQVFVEQPLSHLLASHIPWQDTLRGAVS